MFLFFIVIVYFLGLFRKYYWYDIDINCYIDIRNNDFCKKILNYNVLIRYSQIIGDNSNLVRIEVKNVFLLLLVVVFVFDVYRKVVYLDSNFKY